MKKGFTLVELLIVITIIALLLAIGLVIYQSVLKDGRDAKRQADLKLIQSALEQYHADGKHYPLLRSASVCDNGTFQFGCALKSTDGSKVYLNGIPVGPTDTAEYDYKVYQFNNATPDPTDYESCATTASNCVKYCLYAKRESSNVRIKASGCPDNANATLILEVTSP